jgi:dihydroorotase
MIITVPAATDIHVHLRDPGQTYKTDMREATETARRSGIASVACMPNTRPPIDTTEAVRRLIQRAKHESAVELHIIAAVTMGQKGTELTDFKALKKAGAAALSDDGLPVTSDAVMEQSLLRAQDAGLPLISHCEPETAMVARDLALVDKTGAPLHFAHISLAASIDLIRQAKTKGLPVTCETCPHYLY